MKKYVKENIFDSREAILEEAERIVSQDRNKEYGGPENSFSLIAKLWEPVIRSRCVADGTEVKVDEVTVALLMALLKIARASSNQNHIDSWIDCCGYMACGGELAMLEVES
ncbi:MAG: hypothetical protein KH328_06370 [Staphylococcus sp.]|jgi:hypothetical protein|nr:hypothetical protein [Staphylococcus sp.]